MSAPAFMKFYPADYMADTRLLTLEENGAYMILLMTMWQHGGQLPHDDKTLARVVGVTAARWRKLWPALQGYFTVEDGVITQKRLKKELENAQEKIEKLSSNGRRGGAAKSLKNNDTGLANAQANGPDLPLKAQNSDLRATSVATRTRAELNELESRLRTAAGMEHNPSPNLFDLSPVIELLDAGVDLERVILPKITAIAARGAAGSVKSWRYFTAAIAADLKAKPSLDLPNLSPTGERWQTCLEVARRTQRWSLAWGPPPGATGCKVPPSLLIPGDGDNWKTSDKAA